MVSVKSARLLDQLGVTRQLARGETLVLVGPTYALRKQPEVHVRLLFLKDDEGRLCVGYADNRTGEWQPVESEPFSQRTFGYYQRRLKRIANFVAT